MSILINVRFMPAIVIYDSQFPAGLETLLGRETGIVGLNLIPQVKDDLVYFRTQRLYVGKGFGCLVHFPALVKPGLAKNVKMG